MSFQISNHTVSFMNFGPIFIIKTFELWAKITYDDRNKGERLLHTWCQKSLFLVRKASILQVLKLKLAVRHGFDIH